MPLIFRLMFCPKAVNSVVYKQCKKIKVWKNKLIFSTFAQK